MTQRRDLQALIDAAPVGKMQWRVIICCFLVVMLDGFDTAAIGFIAPDIRTHWQLTAGDLAPLFGAGLLGLTAGALLCGPLSDRFGRKRVIELCVFLFGALSLASAFSPDLQTLVFLRFLTGLGLGGAMPNTITMTSEYLPARRRGALVTLMFCGFTLGSAFGGIVSAQLVPVIGWHGILVLGGVLPLMLFVALLVVLPESPRWQVRRQLPRAVIAKTVSAITRERYVDTHFYLIESASVTKGSIRQLFMGRQLPITLMLWVVFFMSLLIIYLLSSWMPTLLNHRGIDLQHASWVTAAFQIGGTLGALALGVLMDKFNPFRVTGAELCHRRCMHRDDWLKPGRIMANGAGDFRHRHWHQRIAGGAECADRNTLSNTKSRHGRELVKRRGPLRRDCWLAVWRRDDGDEFLFRHPVFHYRCARGDQCGDVNPADHRGSPVDLCP